MIYCDSCDKNISQKFIKKHNKSKTHLYFYNNFVINKYYIGDVLWRDFENYSFISIIIFEKLILIPWFTFNIIYITSFII